MRIGVFNECFESATRGTGGLRLRNMAARRKSKRFNTGDEKNNETSSSVQAKDELQMVPNVEEDETETEEADMETDLEGRTHPEPSPTGETKGGGADAEAEPVIDVRGGAPTVTVSWEKDECPGVPERQICDGEKAPRSEVGLIEESEDETLEEEIKDDGTEMTADENEDVEAAVKATVEDGTEKGSSVCGKRKAAASIDSSPSKKAKVLNDGFCLYVGNLNNSKYFEEIDNALATFFMMQSLLVLDVRLDKAKKHAFIDLASKTDLTRALTLNGQTLLDKPLRIAKAKVKEVDSEKKKKKKKRDPEDLQRMRSERCVYVGNIPPSATKADILAAFPKAMTVRFPGGSDRPTRGVAFVEFSNKNQASALRRQNGKVRLQKQVLTLNEVRQKTVTNKSDSDTKTCREEAPPCQTLFISNLPLRAEKKHLQQIFKNALQINIPQSHGKSKRYAFVEFESVADAENALKSSENSAVLKTPLKVQFSLRSKPGPDQVSSKTLIVLGLHEKTTADTLTEAFDGALSSRIFVDKDTGLSKRFGFVDFESADSCSSAKEAAQDVEIDGRKVTVAFARHKRSQTGDGAARGQTGGEGAGQTPGKGPGAEKRRRKKTKVPK